MDLQQQFITEIIDRSINVQTNPNQILNDLERVYNFLTQRQRNNTEDVLDNRFFTGVSTLINQLIPRSVDEHLTQIRAYGAYYREINKSIKHLANGSIKVKYNDIESRDISTLLLGLVQFLRIGEEDDSSAKLRAYSLDLGIYVADERFIDLFISALQEGVTLRNADEIRRWIDQNTPFVKPDQDPHKIVMGNGIFNIKTQELQPYSPTEIYITRIAIDYNPNARHPTFPNNWTWMEFLNEQFQTKEDIKMAWQTVQYTLLTNMPKNIFMYFYDIVGNSGKSMFAQILKNIVGALNFGVASIEDFSVKFIAASIYDKAFIYGDENDAQYIRFNQLMKSMSTGDPISIEYKGVQPFMARSTPMIIQSMNSTPIFKHLDGGSKRRMRILEFHHSYSGSLNRDVKDVYIQDQEFLEWLTYTALSMPLEDFVDSINSINIKGDIESESNPVKVYVETRMVEFQSEIIPNWLLFADFLAWLKHENKALNWTQTGFMRSLKIELINTNWEVPRNPKRLTNFLKADYDLFYNNYLNVGSLNIGNFLSYERETARLNKPTRVISKEH